MNSFTTFFIMWLVITLIFTPMFILLMKCNDCEKKNMSVTLFVLSYLLLSGSLFYAMVGSNELLRIGAIVLGLIGFSGMVAFYILAFPAKQRAR